MTHIVLEKLCKRFSDGTLGVRDVSLAVEKGETMVLVGPSGCGKSTTLRMIAGLEAPTAGRVLLAGRNVTDLPPEKRDIGLVFQSYALFPQMTVAENVAFGLRMRRTEQTARRRQVAKMLHLMGIEELAQRTPAQLSGGQQQRVAFARALAIEPAFLLLDEPLTALDAKLRDSLRVEIARLLHELGITTIYVTHDLTEAMVLGDRIAVMHDGAIQQCDTPRRIYQEPANTFVAHFIGRTNYFSGAAAEENGQWRVDIGAAHLPLAAPPPAREVVIIFRPEDVTMTPPGTAPHFTATVHDAFFLGPCMRVFARLADGREIVADLDNAAPVQAGQQHHFSLKPGKMVVRPIHDMEA